MPERNADILQVLVGQMGEYGDVNLIVGKTLRVLSETKSPKPVGNLRHIASRFTGPFAQQRQDGAYTFCKANAGGFAHSSACL